jgi:predicted HD phosphohydrolase
MASGHPLEPVARDVDDVLAALEAGTDRRGDDENVTLLEHALQCAGLLALAYPEDVELQVAGLTHDLGHVITTSEADDHAGRGSRFVAGVLGPRVAGLVDLHVTAKRYLVTVDPSYRERLSAVSQATLMMQGDTLVGRELSDFIAGPLWRESVALRRADDMAKWAGLRIGPLHHWRPALVEVSRRFGIMPG